MAHAWAFFISLPLGVIAALYQDRWPDYAIRSITILGLAMPNFWVALLVLLGMVLYFTWTPPVIYRKFWIEPWTNMQIMIWPALVLSWGSRSFLARVTRAQVLDVLRQDYIRTARSKGLSQNTVIVRHVMRNALIPVITVLGGNLDAQLSGTVILENVFGVPGIGQGTVAGAVLRDWPVMLSLRIWARGGPYSYIPVGGVAKSDGVLQATSAWKIRCHVSSSSTP